jgi:flagellar basal body-associated protein FliL
MLGFGKKKKQEAEEKEAIATPPPEPAKKNAGEKGKNQAQESAVVEEAPLEKKKKFITKKRIFILLMVLGAIGASSFLIYTLYFTQKGPGNRVYQKIALPHVKLPQEMLTFSFNHFPDLYDSLVNFNTQITLFNREIQRIDAIGQRYPEQKKITDTEKKVLEKGKNVLLKTFSKLEKPIKEIYVLFQVDDAQGLARIEEKEQELTDMAQAALEAAQEQTKRIKAHAPQAPKGIFQGTLYKLKKKFL